MRNNPFLLRIIRNNNRWLKVAVFICILLPFLFLLPNRNNRSIIMKYNSKEGDNGGDCLVSFGSYKGPKYISERYTRGAPRCLVQSKWLRVAKHSVQLTPSSKIISDWLWIDYHERINVLVESPSSFQTQQERHWLIFQQHKYALEGVSSLAIIGGIIEPGETPQQAAAREIKEEMKITCQAIIFLGRFRTDVNRGMGYTNSFVAMDCSSIKYNEESREQKVEEVGEKDQEQQEMLTMTTSQVREAVSQGKFLEVQWSNTVALSMMLPQVNEYLKT